ncbi:sensor histidine kinase [Hathewaya histolytica]|uniref:histidine kinase n=1 Tax=Hathewaya histolytica TaxID=1498 RepID=A0A4U9RK05_HATHI|nr:ATP-binding protein [Hathewaya histolytica]VTQ92305.1 histidine kinase [Hathewaya histolytica]
MKFSKKVYLLIILVLVENFLIFLILSSIFLMDKKSLNQTYAINLILIIVGLAVIAAYTVGAILKLVKVNRETIEKINSSQEIIDALRAQKHDFKNHLSVVLGLLQLNETNKAIQYMYDINGKIDEVFSISKLNNVEFAAMLHTKVAIAESKGITVELDIDSALDNLYINTVDLCRIFFNLVDNASYELENSKEEEKILSIDIREFEGNLILSVGNSYPLISQKVINKIFDKGFSTKNGEGRGYGLSIVKQLVEKNRGKIDVESYEGVGTIFTVFLPIKKILR